MAAARYPRFELADLNAELIGRLVKHIEKGSTPVGAARMEGIPVGTFRKWRVAGREQIEQAYETGQRKFAIEREALMVLAVEQATAKVAQRLGRQVQDGAEEWRAKLAWLERQERDDFQPAERIDVTVGGSDEPVLIEGREVVLLGNVHEFARQIGLGAVFDALDAGDSRAELPAARDVLPGVAAGERAAGDVSAAAAP